MPTEQAERLAAAGYLAVVPDLYAGRAAVRCIKAAFSGSPPSADPSSTSPAVNTSSPR